MEFLWKGFAAPHMAADRYVRCGGVLIFLAISKKLEPRCFCRWALVRSWSTFLFSGAVDQVMAGIRAGKRNCRLAVQRGI